jgi:hypothetical protein
MTHEDEELLEEARRSREETEELRGNAPFDEDDPDDLDVSDDDELAEDDD